MQRNDKLNGWEKAAIFTTGAGGAFNILLYQLGYTLDDATPANPWLWGARVFFAVVSFIGFDLTLGVTVMAMRGGRRSIWAALTVIVAVLSAGGIALDVSEVWLQPWMHAAPVIVLGAFLLHLAAPPVEHRASTLARKLDQSETDLAQLRNEVDQRDGEIGSLRRRLETALAENETLVEQGGATAAQAAARAAHAEGRVAQLEEALRRAQAEMDRRQAEVDRRLLEDGAVTLDLAGKRISLRDASDRLGIPMSTLSRKLNKEG